MIVVQLDANPDDFDPLQDLVFFSLTRSSNSLVLTDFAGGVTNKSGADIFYVGRGDLSPKRLYTAGNLGLTLLDDIVSFDFSQHTMVRSAMVFPEPATLTDINQMLQVGDLVMGVSTSVTTENLTS